MSTVDGVVAARRRTTRSAATRPRCAGAAGLAVVLTLAGCSDTDDIGLINDSGEAVTVEFGGGESEELPAYGGIHLLEVNECFEGQILVTYGGGDVVDLPGPICPGEELRITADDAEISTTRAP